MLPHLVMEQNDFQLLEYTVTFSKYLLNKYSCES